MFSDFFKVVFDVFDVFEIFDVFDVDVYWLCIHGALQRVLVLSLECAI